MTSNDCNILFELSVSLRTMKKIYITLALGGAVALGACHDAGQTGRPTTPQPSTPVAETAEPPDASDETVDNSENVAGTELQEGTEPLDRPAMADEALGRLVTTLSEDTGDFPSDNFVSNETSYLDVAETMLDEARQGRVYVGVGPEQNLTYLALMEPRMAYIVDIRRENMIEHLVLRALIRESSRSGDLPRAPHFEDATAPRAGQGRGSNPRRSLHARRSDATTTKARRAERRRHGRPHGAPRRSSRQG